MHNTGERTGIELEGLILDLHGNPVSAADEILEDLGEGFVREVDLSTIEIVTDPHHSILETGMELIDQMKVIEEVSRERRYLFLPIDTAITTFEPEIRDMKKYTPKKIILGDRNFELCARVNGTHIHFSQEPGKLAEQTNYILMADPIAIALTSSSPLKGFHNWRLHTYRNEAYEDFPSQGHFQDLKRTDTEYLEELVRGLQEFKRKAEERGITLDESIYACYAAWGPVRPNMKYGTVEARSQGATPFIYDLISYLTLLEGGMRRLRREDVKDAPHPLMKSILAKADIDGDSRKLRELHDKAVKKGMEDMDVSSYCLSFISFAYEGLKDEEKAFVAPFMERVIKRESSTKNLREMIDNYGGTPDIHVRIYNEIYIPQREITYQAMRKTQTREIEHENRILP